MNKKNIKLIALDIDGTLMKSDFTISDKVKEAVNKVVDLDIHVVLATGRMYGATVPIAKELGLKSPLITYQGSLIKEFFNSNNTILHHFVPSQISKKIISELRNLNIHINLYLNDELVAENENEILKEYAEKRLIPYKIVNSFDEIKEINSTKILGIDNNPKKVDEIRDYLKEKYGNCLNITKSTPYFCEIVNNKASKGDAILYLASKYNIKQSEIMAIGDQDNDKDMLEIAGYAVAMGNATDSLKQTANYITESVDNDGVAKIINDLILS